MEKPKYDLKHITALAGLRLNESESALLSAGPESVVAFASRLSDIETERTQDMKHGEDTLEKTREDIAEIRLTREAVLRNVPTAYEGYIVVPRVMDDV